MTVDRDSHSYLLGVAEAEIRHYREILSDLVKVTGADLRKLPEGYRGRYAIDRADAKLADGPGQLDQSSPQSKFAPGGPTDMDSVMQRARRIVEDHIEAYGYVPHPDKLKEAIATELAYVRHVSIPPHAKADQ